MAQPGAAQSSGAVQSSHAPNAPDALRGVVERITYHNPENGYTVAKLAPEGRARFGDAQAGEIPIVGNMAGINVGEFVELQGRWTVHAEYGRQFAVEHMRSVLPATVAGIEKYLGSGLIRGVGPKTAKEIVHTFGAETLDVIEKQPERLQEVPGVGPKRVQMILAAWAEQRAIKEVMIFLQSHGVSTSLATRIYKTYGDAAVGIVSSDPYRLAQDIFGIGFLTADRIAQSLGLAADSPQRVAAGVAFALQQAAEDGHVFLPLPELMRQAAELLSVEPPQVATGVIRLWDEQQIKLATGPGSDELPPASLAPPVPGAGTQDEIPRLIAEHGSLYAASTLDRAHGLIASYAPQAEAGDHVAPVTDRTHDESPSVYLNSLYYSEMGTAGRIQRILRDGLSGMAEFTRPDLDWQTLFQRAEQEDQLRLAPQQHEAVRAALTHRLTILTGGPGTGKTTTVRALLHLCRQAGCRTLLAAPTGRAAKRLAETTGQPAKTLHRLLEFKPAEGMAFQRNEESPLQGDLLIIDEASMLDLALAHHTLRAVPPGMHVLLVGDVDQLPSVGAGNVLQDMIRAVETPLEPTGSGSTGSDSTEMTSPPAEDTRPPIARMQNHSPWTELARRAKVIRLQTIFRQAQGSYIITNAHRINQGQMPTLANQEAQDFFLFRVEEAERAAELCVELVQSRIPKRFAIPPADIQVLSPMHRGVAGVGALNEAIQRAINPARTGKPERQFGNRIYRAGDRVMQIRNNYDKDVYNGDMGIIQKVDLEMQQVTVIMDASTLDAGILDAGAPAQSTSGTFSSSFSGKTVVYDFLELDELIHAYAISVHKSQGSEFPAVVIPILTSHYMMLQRNLLYTAVSRARRLVVLVGQEKAIRIAIGNNRVARRHTGLTERLLGG